METYITIGIAIILGAVVLKVAWNSLKAAIKLVSIITIAAIGLYYYAPDTLNKVISPVQQEQVVQNLDSLKDQTTERLAEFFQNALMSN